MIKTTIKITGMACTMCEAHINEAVRNAFSVKKVKSSHSKGEAVILSEEPLDEAVLRKALSRHTTALSALCPFLQGMGHRIAEGGRNGLWQGRFLFHYSSLFGGEE